MKIPILPDLSKINGKIKIILTFLDFSLGNRTKKSDFSRRFGLPEPDNPYGPGTLKNPSPDFVSRLGRQSRFISPIVAAVYSKIVPLVPDANPLVLVSKVEWCCGSEVVALKSLGSQSVGQSGCFHGHRFATFLNVDPLPL